MDGNNFLVCGGLAAGPGCTDTPELQEHLETTSSVPGRVRRIVESFANFKLRIEKIACRRTRRAGVSMPRLLSLLRMDLPAHRWHLTCNGQTIQNKQDQKDDMARFPRAMLLQWPISYPF